MKLKSKKAIITGANQGFGLAVAEEFLKEGASVTLCARDEKKLLAVCAQLQPLVCEGEKITTLTTDVSKIDEINTLVKTALESMGNIDIVVSNAGVYGPKGPIEENSWEEWSDAIDINLKGTVWLCQAVLPHMKKQASGKIILLSGGGATKPMPFLSAYAASKAAVVRFGETLAEELRDYHIDVNAIAPGALNNRLLDEVLAAGPSKVGNAFYQQSLKQKESGGSSLNVGAKCCVYLASADSDGITGKLISAIWDPWQDLHHYKDHLDKSEIYTLRRIVPADGSLPC